MIGIISCDGNWGVCRYEPLRAVVMSGLMQDLDAELGPARAAGTADGLK